MFLLLPHLSLSLTPFSLFLSHSPPGSDEQIKSQLKAMENGLSKLKAEVKHHKKPQDSHDKFAVKMEVHVPANTCCDNRIASGKCWPGF